MALVAGRPTGSLLEFRLDGHRFALPAAVVREVTRAVALEPLPGAPEVVEGAFNLRGRVVPVLDVRARFRLPPRPLDPGHHFLVVRTGDRTVALRVDRAVEVVTVPPEDVVDGAALEPPARLVAGLVRRPDGLLVIHDPARFLSHQECVQVDRALEQAPPVESADEGADGVAP